MPWPTILTPGRLIRPRGSPVAPEVLIAPPAVPIELRIGPRGRSKPTMIERLGPDCAIGTDGAQWIVFKAVSDPSLQTWQDRQWRAVGFIHSSKSALLACIKAKCLKLSAAGRAAIERQDARIYRWHRCGEG